MGPSQLSSAQDDGVHAHKHTQTQTCMYTYTLYHTSRVCQPPQTESFRQAEAVTVSPCRTTDTPRSLNPYLARQINWSALVFTVTELQGEGEGSPQPYTNS